MREVAPPPTASVRSARDEGNRVGLDVLADADTEGERVDFGGGRGAARHDLALARVFEAQIRSLHQQAADNFLEIEFIAIDRFRMEAHHAPVLLLAQELQHFRRIVRRDQDFREKLVNRAGKFHIPRRGW